MRTSIFRALATAAVAALALAACGSSGKSTTPSTQPATTPTTAAAATTPPTTGASATTTAPSGGTMATVSLAQNATIGKQVLVDDKGLTLYVWDNDTTAGTSTCDANAQCIQAWPPLYVAGTPTYGEGLSAAMFSEITAPNGEKQLAVNGKPLYHWMSDAAPGDAKGQNINGFYVVGADGNKIDAS